MEEKVAQRTPDLNEKNTRLKLLNTLSNDIRSGISVSDTLALTAKRLSEDFPLFRVTYSTIDDSGILNVSHAISPEEMPPLTQLPIDLKAAPAYLSALHLGSPVPIENVATSTMLEPLADNIKAGGTQALLNVPLRHMADATLTLSEKLVGLLCFESPNPHQWSQHETATLTELSQYLTVALREARTQEALVQEQEFLKTVLNNVQSGIVACDANGILTLFNQAAKEFHGLDEQPIPASEWAQLLQAMSFAVETLDAAALSIAAHTLRSSSANLGAITFSKLCQELELMGRSGTTAGAEEKVLQVAAMYEMVKSALIIEQQQG